MCNEEVFRTDQTRKTFFKSRFSYVEQVKTFLGIDAKGKERFYRYVPIKDTIKSLLTQNSVKEQYAQAKADTETTPDVLEDVVETLKRIYFYEIHHPHCLSSCIRIHLKLRTHWAQAEKNTKYWLCTLHLQRYRHTTGLPLIQCNLFCCAERRISNFLDNKNCSPLQSVT